MSEPAALVGQYATSVRHPDVSGFEILDLLRLRSRLAELETELDSADRAALETADAMFLSNAPTLHRNLSGIAALEEFRRAANVRPSHWWWYLDALVRLPVS